VSQECVGRFPAKRTRYELRNTFRFHQPKDAHVPHLPAGYADGIAFKRGKCHEREIASELLARDESQIEYYKQITNNMVGRVLRDHQIVERDRATNTYRLLGYETLSAEQKTGLTNLCQKKLEAFIEARGRAIYDHRRVSVGYISGTIKYEVLKRARFRCELCGTSGDEKALEPDHVVPRIHGGLDDLSNLQALGYSCNAMKRDRDYTDFRAIRESYAYREPGCPLPPSTVVYWRNRQRIPRQRVKPTIVIVN
jgi:ATP adenylyltransferase